MTNNETDRLLARANAGDATAKLFVHLASLPLAEIDALRDGLTDEQATDLLYLLDEACS